MKLPGLSSSPNTERTGPRGAAQIVLLDICANPDADHSLALQNLGEVSARRLANYAASTRTASLVARTVRAASLDEQSPLFRPFANEIAPTASAHAVGALGQGQAAARTLAILAEHSLHPIALKGLSLAFRDYPDPALRPIRDIDLLLEPEGTLAAERILLDHPDYKQRFGVAKYGLDYSHQLPEIEHKPSGLVIELHHRINARDWVHEPELVIKLRDGARPLDLLGQQVLVPDAESNFLHLIEHATLHHLFANGPLILSDLHYLAQGGLPCWQALRDEASRFGLGKGLALLAQIASQHGAQWVPEGWINDNDINQELVDNACLAMFERGSIRQKVAMANRVGEDDGRPAPAGAAIARALRPSANQLSRLSGHHSQSIWRWLGYPAWLIEKGMRYRALRSDPRIAKAAADRRKLRQWLVGE